VREPAWDVRALVDALVAFSYLVRHLGDEVSEMDVNPLICGPDGCVAVDALLVTKGGSSA
jgi:hypothetical protein